MAEGVGGDAGDVRVVADDVAHRPGADRRKLGVAVPQLAVDVGVRKEVPANSSSPNITDLRSNPDQLHLRANHFYLSPCLILILVIRLTFKIYPFVEVQSPSELQ